MNVTRAKADIASVKRKARELAASLGVRYSLALSLPPDDAQHLGWFDAGTRRQPARPVLDLMQRAPTARDAMVRVMTTRIQQDIQASGRLNMLVTLTIGAQELRAVWVDRLTTSGADVRWAPLSPRYAAHKRRRGLDPRIGVATGSMLAAVRGGQLIIRKVQ